MSLTKYFLWQGFLVAFHLVAFQLNAQYDQQLISELDSMVESEIGWRIAYTEAVNQSADSLALAQLLIDRDSLHRRQYSRLNSLFLTHGYLGHDVVGKSGSHDFWFLVNELNAYPDFQEAVLLKMEEAVDVHNASYASYAYMLDKVRVRSGQLQVYGTQVAFNRSASSFLPQPVEKPESLDARREKAGLPPMNMFIKLLNRRYFSEMREVSYN